MIDCGTTCKVARKTSEERICWNNLNKMILFYKSLMSPKGHAIYSLVCCVSQYWQSF